MRSASAKHLAVRVASVLLAIVAVGLVAWFGGFRGRYLDWRYDRVFEGIDRSESVITVLTRDTSPVLTKGALNLEVPSSAARALFADRVRYTDLAPNTEMGSVGGVDHLGVRFFDVAIDGETREGAPEDLRLWRPFLDRVDYFDHAKFYVIDGHFANDAETRYETKTGFKGLATLKDGREVYAKGTLKVEWRAAPDPGAKEGERRWLIDGFHVVHFELQESPQLLFNEVLDVALPDAETLARARRSIHEELVLEQFVNKEKFQPPYKYFSWPSFDRHPGVSVVDLDRDGFDDFYLVERHGRNMFFRNLGNGSFEEIAGDLGLDLEGHSASTLFADFDNDGDTDAFVGRTLLRSAYFENIGGRFENRTLDQVTGDLPFLVSSVSAVDYDRDGLLDVYFSTYASQIIRVYGIQELEHFLSPDDMVELARLQAEPDAHRIKNRPGPPNVLVKNLGGGRFEVVEAEPLKVWHNTYQSTWADYDGDGDMDVYVANDFATNNLVRNDGGGHFTDITGESQTADIGFGMGATWGDYDNDGRQDLYVTNMFSKAGRRITAKAGPLGNDFAPMAYGNSLLHAGDDGRFERVSGLERPSIMVSEAGWSWGSQFADFDNDGFLDIFALSGFYTTPRRVEIAEDT